METPGQGMRTPGVVTCSLHTALILTCTYKHAWRHLDASMEWRHLTTTLLKWGYSSNIIYLTNEGHLVNKSSDMKSPEDMQSIGTIPCERLKIKSWKEEIAVRYFYVWPQLDMYIHVHVIIACAPEKLSAQRPHLVNTAAPFSPRCNRAGFWSNRASRKFCTKFMYRITHVQIKAQS